MGQIFQKLLDRLNRVFNKSAVSVPAFQIKPPTQCQMIIDSSGITITAVDTTSPLIQIPFTDPYDSAKSITIQQLYNSLQGDGVNYVPGIYQIAGFSVQNLSSLFTPVGAIALVDGTYTLEPNIYNNVMVATSVLWSFFKPVARILETARGDVDLAIQQLGFITAQGDFLDYWGGIFGIPRYQEEPDYEYSIRLLWETVKPRLNNKALEELLFRGVGYQTKIVDMSTKVLLTDGVPNPITEAEYTDSTQITDGWISGVKEGFPEDPSKYAFGGQPYNLGSFGVYIDVPITSAYYQYTTNQLEEIVNRHRAGGTTPWFFIDQVASEILSLINEVAVSLEQAINQVVSEQRAVLFGHPDYQFYCDHWGSGSVASMPWEQDNLDKPSLTDNVVLQPQQVTVPAVYGTVVESLFTGGSLVDGFIGGHNRNVFHVDSFTSDHVDDNKYYKTLAFQYLKTPAVIGYLNNICGLNYGRVSDDFITPRVVEILSNDTMTKPLSTVSGPVTAWDGSGSLSGVTSSTDLVITSPIKITAPVSITGVKFDAVKLTQMNIHNVPIVIPNLNIEDFGDHWQEDYAETRMWLVPVQDSEGNRYYTVIILPWLYPPPVAELQILNPTAHISSDYVLIISGQTVTISWNVTQAQSATLIQTDLDTGLVVSNIPVIYSGSITYDGSTVLTNNTLFTISALGNNGQLAQASIEVRIYPEVSTAVAPTIIAKAVPSVVQLCSQNATQIQYSVNFNSVQTEEQVVSVPDNASSFVLSPLVTDPAGTVILSNPLPEIVRTIDSAIIEGGWIGLDTPTATFLPLNVDDISGYTFDIAYNVNYGGSELYLNGNSVDLGAGELFQISQDVNVQIILPLDYKPGQPFNYNFTVSASNYASKASLTIPVYVQPVQQGAGMFQVVSLTPNTLVEAIGNTINETVAIVANGTGFSSNIQVYLKQPVSIDGSQTYQWQYIQAAVQSVDWVNGACTFIAPRMTKGTYPISVWNLDCVGNVISKDESQSLIYTESTYRHPPIINDFYPKTVCIPNGFISSPVYIYGSNFRNGAYVTLWGVNGPVTESTIVVSPTIIRFTMDQSVYGLYRITVVNADTSSGSSNSSLLLLDSTIPVVITNFSSTAPLNDSGNAQYGYPFVLDWSVNNASTATFTSSDPNVQSQLVSPDPNGWPANLPGSLTVNVFYPGTTITMVAVNACGNTDSSTITINDIPGERTTGIVLVPNPIVFNEPFPLKVHCLRTTHNDVTGEDKKYDITNDPGLVYNLAGQNTVVTLTNKVLTPIVNGHQIVEAKWRGFYDSANIYVQLAVPSSLAVSPSQIDYGAINQTYQLTAIATYSDGTEKDVTNLCNYHGYDSALCSVNSVGILTTLQMGNTIIQCDYVDHLAAPQTIVTATVGVGPQDSVLNVEQLFVLPEYSIAGLTTPSVSFNAVIDNVRTAVLNGISIQNSALQPVWNYKLTDIITTTKQYRLTASNFSGSVTNIQIANVLNFSDAVINSFTIYNPTNIKSQAKQLVINFGEPVGLLWNTSYASSVKLTDDVTGNTYNLPSSGNWYALPVADTTYTLTVVSPNGTSVTAFVSVSVTDAQYFVSFLKPQTNPVQPGENVTLQFPSFTTKWLEKFFNQYLKYQFNGGKSLYPNSTLAEEQSSFSLNQYRNKGVIDTNVALSVNLVSSYNFSTTPSSYVVSPSCSGLYELVLDISGTWTYTKNLGHGELEYLEDVSFDWATSLWNVANYDPGPTWVTAVASSNNVSVGDPVTITYQCNNASVITGDFVNGQNLPLGYCQLVVYPNRTTDYLFTATSITGQVSQVVIHIDVKQQNTATNSASLPIPSVGTIAIDGFTIDNNVLTINQQEQVHVLEIFGNHFLSDRSPTQQVIGNVIVNLNNPNSVNSNLDLVSVDSISNIYIRCKIRSHSTTVAGNYNVFVINDVGISNELGIAQSFVVDKTLPKIVMNQSITAPVGTPVVIWVDSYDPNRDGQFTVLLDGTAYTPSTIGSNLDDTDFITQLYGQILNRIPTSNELMLAINNLESDVYDRYDLMSNLLDSTEYVNSGRSVSVGVGTPVMVVFDKKTACGISLQTVNGTSGTGLQWIPIPV